MGRYAFWSLEKRCGRCGLTVARKHAAEHFGLSRNTYDGLQAKCKKCAYAYLRKWQKANPAKCRAYNREYERRRIARKIEAARDGR